MTTNLTEAQERLQKARTGLVIGNPFFGFLALKLDLNIDPNAPSAFWINGQRLAVHPEVAMEMPMEELEAMIARGTLHAALMHPFRRGDRDMKRWSEACAHVAGLELKSAGFHLPADSPADPAYLGMTAEDVYRMLTPPPEEGDSGGGGGKPPPAPQNGPQGGQGDQGGGNDPGENGTPDGAPSPGSGEVRDAPGDQAAISDQEADWREAVAQAAQTAKAAGNLPGSVSRLADEVLSPKVSWREALQRFFKARASDDYSWMRPNRRYIAHGFYLPSQQSVKMGPIAIAVDMSGSISQKELNQFIGEMEAIRDECKPECVVILPFDTSVREIIVRGDDDDLAFKARAGGGTDFRPAVEVLAEAGIEPDALVYLTDLDCNSFPTEPAYPVLWVSTSKEKAPFGEVIRLD